MIEHGDIKLLERVLDEAKLTDAQREAFDDMLAKLHRSGSALSPKQRAWAQVALYGERYEPEPEYENLVSAGRVPRGRPVPTPAVLTNLPKRPPVRRREND